MGFRGGRGNGGYGRRNWFRATGMTGQQRAAAGMPAYGGGPMAPDSQVAPPNLGDIAQENELTALKEQAAIMEQQMASLRERIEQLEK